MLSADWLGQIVNFWDPVSPLSAYAKLTSCDALQLPWCWLANAPSTICVLAVLQAVIRSYGCAVSRKMIYNLTSIDSYSTKGRNFGHFNQYICDMLINLIICPKTAFVFWFGCFQVCSNDTLHIQFPVLTPTNGLLVLNTSDFWVLSTHCVSFFALASAEK